MPMISLNSSSDISESDIDMVLSGNDLVITLEGEASTDTLTLENWKTSAAAAKVTKFRMGGQLYTIQSYLDASIGRQPVRLPALPVQN